MTTSGTGIATASDALSSEQDFAVGLVETANTARLTDNTGAANSPLVVTLFDGSSLDLANLTWRQLVDLQWDQERAFARRIKQSAKGSAERAEAFARGYDTVCTIVGRRQELAGGGAEMGFDGRYIGFVERVLARTRERGRQQRVFEVGHGPGKLLAALAQRGVGVAGVEVSSAMHDQAAAVLGADHDGQLLLGDFLTIPLDEHLGQYDVVYWNDVLEHIPVDEAHDFVARIHALLRPGGSLITITPNWHMRPSDVTDDFKPRRTEAEGFHLKEYTLAEVCQLARDAGFDRVDTPLVVLPNRIVLAGNGLAALKRRGERLLEYLPFRPAQKLCRLLSLSITIARKAE